MAQAKIKKLQSGGTLVVDGEEYNLREVNDAISVLSPEEQQYMAGLSKALAAGNNWTASSYDNTFTGAGVNDWMSSVFGSKERADRKLGKTSHLSKTFDATVGNTRDAIRRASSRFFLNLRHEYTADASSNPENDELAELLRGSGWFDFDKEGKYVSGPSNAGKMKIYDDAILHFLSPETERKKKKHDSWGSSYDDLLNWIAGKPGASDYFQDLKNKILAGGKDLDAQDLDVLKLLGFDPSASTNANVPQGVSAFKTKFGLSDDNFNTYFGTDENGNILPKQEFFSLLGLDPTSGNYWLNDAFRQSKGWNNAVLPWIKDLWWINGKLYKGGEQELLDKLNIMGFQNKNTLGDYTGSDSLVRWLWGQETPVSYDRAAYSNFLNDLHGRYFDQRYYLPDEDGFTNIVKYYDFNDDVDQYGLRKAKYAALDEYGNVKSYLDENVIAALQPYLDEEGNGVGLDLYRRGNSDKKDLDYYNTYVKQIGDNITAYINPTPNPSDTDGFESGYVILDLPRNDKNANSITRNLDEDESIKIPYKIWQMFGNNDEFWRKLVHDDDLREEFYNTMEVLVGNVYSGDIGQRLISNSGNILSAKQWEKLGVSAENAKALFEWTKRQNPDASGTWRGAVWKDSVFFGQGRRRREAEERHDKNTVRRMQTNELGGWLPKMQEGGVFGGSNFQRKEKEPVKIKKVEDSTKSKDLFNPNDHWTSSDSLDLASTIVDLGSLAATFAPGLGNIAGAVGGAAADFMRFSSNVSRDGMDVGDWVNLGAGLGMDAVTLLPIVGTGAKAAKLMKTLTKVSKPLSKIFLAVGATEAATALGHLVTTGEFTVEDFRKVAMGAQAAMGHFHIKRAAHAEADLANAINKIIKTEVTATPKVKIGTKEIDILDESVLRSIAGKKPKEAADELKSILKRDRGLVDDDLKDVTDSDLLKAFGFKENKGVLSWFKKTTLLKEKKIGEGDISGRRLSWGEPKHKWNNGEVQTADEFIDAQLANPEIRAGLAKQGWFRNITSPDVKPMADSRINYLATRLAQMAPAGDFSASVGNTWTYKGRRADADWIDQRIKYVKPTSYVYDVNPAGLNMRAVPVVEPEPVIPNLPVRVQPSGTPVRISPEPIAPGRSRVIKTQYNAPATGTIVTPFRQVRPNRMLPGRPYPTVPALGKEQRGMISLNPDNFAEVLQNIVYKPRFRQLVKTNPVAARQLFDRMRFNYIMYGTNGTALTRGQEFDEMAEVLKAFNGLRFKKGGKIIKGQDGIKSWDYDNLTPEQRNKLHANLSDEEFEEYLDLLKRQKAGDDAFRINSWDVNARRYSNPFDSLYDRNNSLYNVSWARLYALQHKNRHGVDPENDPDLPTVDSALKPSLDKMHVTTNVTSSDPIKTEFKSTVNPESDESTTMNRAGSGVAINSADLFDAARAMVSANGLQKQYDLLDKANRARLLQQMNAPQLVAPKVNTGRERYIAEQAASRLMQDDLPDITNDSKLRMAARLGQHAQAEGMRYEGLKAETEAITKQHQLDADIHNKQQQLDVDAANKRSQLLADVESKGLQLKADKQRVLSTRIVDPLLQQYGQQLRDEQNKLDALYQEAELAEKQRQANDYMYDELKRNDLYNVWKKSEEYKLDGTDNGYLSWLNANHPELYRMVKNRVYNQFRVPYSKYDIAKNNRRYWWSYLINPKQEE